MVVEDKKNERIKEDNGREENGNRKEEEKNNKEDNKREENGSEREDERKNKRGQWKRRKW
jgi:hypothetical protein